jgi:peptidoglycan hydrolase-like protein with peptidoglycan-binding domain
MRMRASIAIDDDTLPPTRRAFGRRLLRPLLQQPMATMGYTVALGLATAIIVNALALQAGPHPAPLVPGTVLATAPKETTGSLTPPASRPAPAQTAAQEPQPQRARAQLITAIQQELAARGFYDGAIDGLYGPRMDAGIREFEQAAGLRVSGEPSEALLEAVRRSKLRAVRRTTPAAQPASATDGRAEPRAVPNPPSRRIVAVQRALSDFGYGQLRLTGVFDDATKAAIERFERERKLPVRGQITDRLLRELAAVTGRPLE